MNYSFAVYRTSDGLVLRTGKAPACELISIQAQEGEAAVEAAEAVQADGRWRWTGDDFAQDPLPEPTLEELKAAKLEELASYATPKLDLWGAPVGGLDVDDVSTARLNAWATQAIICLMTGDAFDLPYWIMADNSHRAFTDAGEFLAFAKAAAAYKTAALLNNSNLKLAINAATDEAALAGIDITEGWPT